MYTLEIANILEDILTQQPELLQNFYRSQQDLLAPALVDIMNRGVKVDLVKKQQLLDELSLLLVHIESTINTILGETINLKSSHQVKRLCTDLLQVVPVIDRKSKTASFGSEAMLVYLDNYPLYRPLITLILEYRSVGIFVRTFLSAKVDDDNRMRTSYNLAGTRTYRLASRKNAFGAGMNLQNVPAKGKIDLKYSLMRLDSETEVELEDDEDAVDIDTPVYGTTKLPNCKELFICEEDEMFFDIDLAAADARIIAWVSGCPFLTDLFEDEDGDPYLLLAREYYRNPNLTKKNNERQIFKAVVHGTNYLGQAKTLSAKAGLLVREIEKIQKFYFSLCPEIPALHRAIEQQVRERGYLENVWGARGWFLDKNDPMLMNKAVAWVGSSPVGILINKGLVSIREQDPAIKVLLQVHDSLAGVYKKDDVTAPDRIVKYCSVPLPFEIPRVIPVNIKTSPTSYGDCG
jgi:DNA polymerase I-like protein with 3'-5' exonuclease and polymerase domains